MSPLTAPAAGMHASRGTKRRYPATTADDDGVDGTNGGGEASPPRTPARRLVDEAVIDLCTPSPAVQPGERGGRMRDVLGLGGGSRKPLAERGVPNTEEPLPPLPPLLVREDKPPLGQKLEHEDAARGKSLDGYLKLCRLTQQASSRRHSPFFRLANSDEQETGGSVLPREPEEEEEREEKETEEEKNARRQWWVERNARMVLGRSRDARKGFVVRGRVRSGSGSGSSERTAAGGASMNVDSASVPFMHGTTISTRSAPTHRPRLVPISTRARTDHRYLSSFRSDPVADVLYVEPNPDHAAFRRRDWSPVYACAYSHAAKRGSGQGPQHLALASESGTIKLFDTRYAPADERALAPGVVSSAFYPHSNAIFEVQWDDADERVLTASGDQTGAVHRAAEAGWTRDATLVGHTSSVKTCAWYDHNTVLTAGRDGNIHIYDLRTAGAHGGWSDDLGVEEGRYLRARGHSAAQARGGGVWDSGRIGPVLVVRNAHGEGTGAGRKPSARSAVRSVTSILALQTDPNLVASGGSADGVIKLWDLRAQLTSSRRIYVSQPAEETLDRTAERGKRSRGVISLAEARGNVYALCNDARIHPHSIQSPRLTMPGSYSHPSLTNQSFYLKLAVSPCEGYLACGTQQGRFAMWAVRGEETLPLPAWEWSRPFASEGASTASASGVGSALLRSGGPNSDAAACRGDVIGVEIGGAAAGGHTREVGAIDWALGQIATGSDDYTSRIWRAGGGGGGAGLA